MAEVNLEMPGRTYVGKDGKERCLVCRGEQNRKNVFEEKENGNTFCWCKVGTKKLFYCWVSTWRAWVKERV